MYGRLQVGMTVTHFKSDTKRYKIFMICNVMDCSNNDTVKKVVIYVPTYKVTNADGEPIAFQRDYDDFMAEVDKIKYPDSKQKYVFECAK